MLRRNAAALGLPDGFSVLDPSDASDVMDLVRHETGVASRTGRRFPRKGTLLDLYSRSVNTGRTLTDTVADVAPWCTEQIEPIAEVCRGYVELKRARGLLDFDDLLLYWRAAAAHPELGAALGATAPPPTVAHVGEDQPVRVEEGVLGIGQTHAMLGSVRLILCRVPLRRRRPHDVSI